MLAGAALVSGSVFQFCHCVRSALRSCKVRTAFASCLLHTRPKGHVSVQVQDTVTTFSIKGKADSHMEERVPQLVIVGGGVC